MIRDGQGHGQGMICDPPEGDRRLAGLKGIVFGLWTGELKAQQIMAALDAVLLRFAIDVLEPDTSHNDAGAGPPTAG